MQQALIAFIVLCCIASFAINMYVKNIDLKEKERIAEIEKTVNGPGIRAFTGAFYTGDEIVFTNDKGIYNREIPLQSIIVPKKFKAVTYYETNMMGVKVIYTGPTAQDDVYIKSMEWSMM